MANFFPCPLCQKKNFSVVFKGRGRQVVKCQNDGLVMVNPQPSQKKLDRLYDSDYFQNLDPYLKEKDAHLRYFRQKLVQIEKKTGRKGKLLDIGCGWGFLLSEAKKRGWQGWGIDISDYALDYCRKQGLKVKKGTWETAKLPRGVFDVVTSFQTIEHELNPLAHVNKIYRLLKTGGIVVITTPNYDSWTRKLMGRNWFGYRHLHHLYFLTPEVLKKMLKKAGFRRFEIKRDRVRIFTLSYYLTRLADFYPHPFAKKAANMVKRVIGKLPVPIPTDPWGDILVFTWK